MNINFKFLLLGTSLSLIPTITNSQCVATTDCATLGYTETSCPDGKGLKCPFGNTFACPASDKSVCEKYGFKYTCSGTGYDSGAGQSCNNKYASCNCSSGYEWKAEQCKKYSSAILGQCSGYAKNCKIGDILNNDGICSNDKVSGKTPIGIVVYIDGDNCGQALALKDLGNIQWGNDGIDISYLPNYDGPSDVEQDFDSCGNTQKIIKVGNSTMYPAAWATVNYAPSSIPATKGKWCLPAMGVALSMINNYSTINSGVLKVGGELLPSLSDDSYWNWSSSERNRKDAWAWNYARGVWYNRAKYYGSYVRPVLEF